MRLIYFTHRFPTGKAVNWKLFELEVFDRTVESIVVVPFFHDSEIDEHLKLPLSIQVTRPLLTHFKPGRIRKMLMTVFASRHRAFVISEFFKFKVFASKSRFVNWLIDSYHLCNALNSPVLTELTTQSLQDTVWYFYWGRGPAMMIPFLKKKLSARIACRFHGYDLYKERSNGYIPYQEMIIAHADLLLPCSTDGSLYLKNNFKVTPNKIFVARLGTRFQGIANIESGSRLNIVSCSFCVPVKRIHLIFDSLEKLDIPYSWTHIGDGPLFSEFQERSKHFNNSENEVNFIGYLPSKSVVAFYLEHRFDVFINVSESEGVPVSIMEALSVGLPVIATDVGGTGEIVDDAVGFLIERDLTGVNLASHLKRFSAISKQKIQGYRESAINRFKLFCDADTNAHQLYEKLRELI
jgi:colanic acid/amylovoran biosynthesis glycosyltransferase